ncbi:MAG TPA: hypothetical protein VF109_10880 [Mycobacteriales bacterium]
MELIDSLCWSVLRNAYLTTSKHGSCRGLVAGARVKIRNNLREQVDARSAPLPGARAVRRGGTASPDGIAVRNKNALRQCR